MNFRQTLDKHLRAITSRDLPSLVTTLPDEELVLIMSDGRVSRSVHEFVEAHRAWFEMPHWQLDAQPLQIQETADMGVAVFRLDYSDLDTRGECRHELSILTLIFARRNGRWVMVHDQNTPIKSG